MMGWPDPQMEKKHREQSEQIQKRWAHQAKLEAELRKLAESDAIYRARIVVDPAPALAIDNDWRCALPQFATELPRREP